MNRLWPILALSGLLACVPARRQSGFGEPQILAAPATLAVLKDAQIVDYGRVVYRGDVDLNPDLRRVRAGKVLAHRNDGEIFRNRERRLPNRERDYYREFVVPAPKTSFPGPARMVIGRDGTVWFTGDHYDSFRPVPGVGR